LDFGLKKEMRLDQSNIFGDEAPYILPITTDCLCPEKLADIGGKGAMDHKMQKG
jgi:hypothetical protein